MPGDFLTVVGMLIVFAGVVFLAWVTTKVLGRKMAAGSRNKTMRILETLPLGLDRCLYLIKVGKKTFLFQGSRKSMELVSEIELDEDVLQEQDADNSKIFDFKRIFDSYSGLLSKSPKNAETAENGTGEAPRGEGIQGSIKKLQRITQGKEYKG